MIDEYGNPVNLCDLAEDMEAVPEDPIDYAAEDEAEEEDDGSPYYCDYCGLEIHEDSELFQPLDEWGEGESKFIHSDFGVCISRLLEVNEELKLKVSALEREIADLPHRGKN